MLNPNLHIKETPTNPESEETLQEQTRIELEKLKQEILPTQTPEIKLEK
jgi:hypothetical protein